MNIGTAGHYSSKCNYSNTGNFKGKRELNNLCFSSASRLMKATVLHTELSAHLTCRLLPQTYANGKGKAIPLEAWTGPEGSRRLRLPDFKTIDA